MHSKLAHIESPDSSEQTSGTKEVADAKDMVDVKVQPESEPTTPGRVRCFPRALEGNLSLTFCEFDRSMLVCYPLLRRLWKRCQLCKMRSMLSQSGRPGRHR
eukprot:2679235-Prymnesium_polylepis.2